MNIGTFVTQQSEGVYFFFCKGTPTLISPRGNKTWLWFCFKYILLVFKWVLVRHCWCGCLYQYFEYVWTRLFGIGVQSCCCLQRGQEQPHPQDRDGRGLPSLRLCHVELQQLGWRNCLDPGVHWIQWSNFFFLTPVNKWLITFFFCL